VSSDLTLRLPNTFDALTGANEEITQFLEEHSTPPDAVFAANLAIEELFTNIVKYGYDDTAAHEILLRIAVLDGELRIEITDDGHEFNPFDQPEPDTSLPAEERPIGGLGIHFVRNMLDHCAYCRNDGKNTVTLRKKFS
jgi:serine/threonine-protein kinase RsbW